MEKRHETLSDSLDDYLKAYRGSDEGGIKMLREAFIAGALAYYMLESMCMPRLDGEVTVAGLLGSAERMGRLRVEVIALSNTIAGLTS